MAAVAAVAVAAAAAASNRRRSCSFLGAAALSAASLSALATVAAGAGVPGPAVPADPVTERVRAHLLDMGGDEKWGADPPAAWIRERGTPVAATVLHGYGHSMVILGKGGKPLGSHLALLHVRAEGPGASATECVLRMGRSGDRSCPAKPTAEVDCATFPVPLDRARETLAAARHALFVRMYEKKFGPDPTVERDDGGDYLGGFGGGGGSFSSGDFLAAAHVVEAAGKDVPRLRVSEAWAGYPGSDASGKYARALAATDLLREAFVRPGGAPVVAPPADVHAEFTRLLASLPLDAEYWWWVRERMALMASTLGRPAVVARLEKWLVPSGTGPSDERTRAYALEALARRTKRDVRCRGGVRLDDAAAAAAWTASGKKRKDR